MHLRFDENDDLVVEDIPDDIMQALDRRAALSDSSTEDVMRALLLQLLGEAEAADE